MGEETPAFHVDLALLRKDHALDLAPRPERMAHCAPRALWVRAVERLTVLAYLKARGRPLNREVDDTLGIDHGFDGVFGTVFGEGDGDVVGKERRHFVRKAGVLEVVGRP